MLLNPPAHCALAMQISHRIEEKQCNKYMSCSNSMRRMVHASTLGLHISAHVNDADLSAFSCNVSSQIWHLTGADTSGGNRMEDRRFVYTFSVPSTARLLNRTTPYYPEFGEASYITSATAHKMPVVRGSRYLCSSLFFHSSNHSIKS